MERKEKEIQKIWNEGIVNDFIRRMLLYYDPMDLIFFATPDDEYDSYIPKILGFLSENIDQDFLEKKIYTLFHAEENNEIWRRKTHRMVEDLVYFLGQKDKFDFTIQIRPRD